jgi:hypothetical protein
MFQENLGGFGDLRLRRVGKDLLGAMCQNPTTCIHALRMLTTHDVTTIDNAKEIGPRNQELTFGRFLDHSCPLVSPAVDDRAGVQNIKIGRHANGRLTGYRSTQVHQISCDSAHCCRKDYSDRHSVSYNEMLTTTARFTGQRAAGRHVLAIQDTTVPDRPKPRLLAAPALWKGVPAPPGDGRYQTRDHHGDARRAREHIRGFLRSPVRFII